MSGNKYKVTHNGQFLGHHCANSPAEAVQKMFKTNYPEFYNVTKEDTFEVFKSGKQYNVCL